MCPCSFEWQNHSFVSNSYHISSSNNLPSAHFELKSTSQALYRTISNKIRTYHDCSGMMGNQDKMVEKLKVCIGIQSQIILAD